jgi:tRNA pseudouridine55 synthase
MDGVLLIDKPAGLTSHDVVYRLRRMLNIKSIGHAGTLDPDATGLLVVCIGKATKISAYLMEGQKIYDVGFRLGLETNTYDLGGRVLAERPVQVCAADIEQTIRSMLGQQEQRPPKFSAVKVGGRKLYEYARADQDVDVPIRSVVVYSMLLKRFDSPSGRLEILCSKGTYVRSLVHEIGVKLGTGAVATEIRRRASGEFQIENAITLKELEEAPHPMSKAEGKMISIAQALSNQAMLGVSEAVLEKVLHGNALSVEQVFTCQWHREVGSYGEPIIIVSPSGDAVALGKITPHGPLTICRVL